MAFIGSVFKSIGNAVSSFAKSGLGSMLIQGAGMLLGGPVGGAIAKAATNLIASKDFSLKNILKQGLTSFAPLAGPLVGNLVSKLPAALQAPIGNIAGNLLKGKLPTVNDLGNVLGQTSIGQKITGILGKASDILGMGSKFGMSAQNAISSVTNVLGKFGINTSGLGNISDTIGKVLGSASKIQDIIGKAAGFLNPMSSPDMLRA